MIYLIFVGKSSGVYNQIIAKVVDTPRLPIIAITTIGQSFVYTPRSKGNIKRKAVPPMAIQMIYGHRLPALISNTLYRNK